MKRFLGFGLSGVLVVAVACVGLDSLTGPKTETHGGVASLVTTQGTPCPSPSPLPLAIFSEHQTVQSCPTSPSALNAVFKVHPLSGPAPLDVAFNMCQSSDSDPAVILHFHVDFGDGGSIGGNTCNFHHTYTSPGTFSSSACVWDGNPVTSPGTCQPFTIAVAPSCAVTFSNPRVPNTPPTFGCAPNNCQGCIVQIDAQTTGNGTCGSPLVVDVSGQSFSGPYTVGTQGPCLPGGTCTLTFEPVPHPSFPPGPVNFTAVNAVGGFTWVNYFGCGG